MKAKVWYAKNFTGFVNLDVKKETLEETHVFVKEVEYEEDMENVFFFMQAEQWSPNGEARGLIESLGLQHTSMAVGDIVETNGELYQAAMFGWLKLKDDWVNKY